MNATNDPLATIPQWSEVAGQWFKAYQAGLETMLTVANAAIAGLERTHMAQIEANVEAQTQNRETALAAARAHDLNALLALQSKLAEGYLESSMRYWSTCAELIQQTSAEILRLLNSRGGEWGRIVQGAYGAGMAPAAMQPPFAAAFQAMRASQEAMAKSVAALAPAAAGAKSRDGA